MAKTDPKKIPSQKFFCTFIYIFRLQENDQTFYKKKISHFSIPLRRHFKKIYTLQLKYINISYKKNIWNQQQMLMIGFWSEESNPKYDLLWGINTGINVIFSFLHSVIQIRVFPIAFINIYVHIKLCLKTSTLKTARLKIKEYKRACRTDHQASQASKENIVL